MAQCVVKQAFSCRGIGRTTQAPQLNNSVVCIEDGPRASLGEASGTTRIHQVSWPSTVEERTRQVEIDMLKQSLVVPSAASPGLKQPTKHCGDRGIHVQSRSDALRIKNEHRNLLCSIFQTLFDEARSRLFELPKALVVIFFGVRWQRRDTKHKKVDLETRTQEV